MSGLEGEAPRPAPADGRTAASRDAIRIPDEADRTAATGGVLRGNPSDEELAAVTAVLAAVFASGRVADRPRDMAPKRSAWRASQRAPRGQAGDPFATRFGRL